MTNMTTTLTLPFTSLALDQTSTAPFTMSLVTADSTVTILQYACPTRTLTNPDTGAVSTASFDPEQLYCLLHPQSVTFGAWARPTPLPDGSGSGSGSLDSSGYIDLVPDGHGGQDSTTLSVQFVERCPVARGSVMGDCTATSTVRYPDGTTSTVTSVESGSGQTLTPWEFVLTAGLEKWNVQTGTVTGMTTATTETSSSAMTGGTAGTRTSGTVSATATVSSTTSTSATATQKGVGGTIGPSRLGLVVVLLFALVF